MMKSETDSSSEACEKRLRGRHGKALTWAVVILGFLLAVLEKEVHGFATIAAAAVGTLNLATAAGRYNYRPERSTPPSAYRDY